MDKVLNDFLINTLPLPLMSEKSKASDICVEVIRKTETIGLGWLDSTNVEVKCGCGMPAVFFFDLVDGLGIVKYCTHCGENEIILYAEEIVIDNDLKE